MEILIPTINRHHALAVTLSGLAAQSYPFNLIIADQSDEPIDNDRVVTNLFRILEFNGHRVDVIANPIKRGIAQQRQLLFEKSSEDHLLCLDDDVWLAPGALHVLEEALTTLECGFVGMPLIGLSHLADIRPDEQSHLEYWQGRPTPETITPTNSAWQRHQLHNAANPAHLGQGLEGWRAYKVAWVGGCAMYRRSALLDVGAWSFWSKLPDDHAGEDVAVQLKIMARFGGAGILPSQAFHQELPTTIENRSVQAYL